MYFQESFIALQNKKTQVLAQPPPSIVVITWESAVHFDHCSSVKRLDAFITRAG
jgi:hypothetical protein